MAMTKSHPTYINFEGIGNTEIGSIKHEAFKDLGTIKITYTPNPS